jgi:hypothetical protein
LKIRRSTQDISWNKIVLFFTIIYFVWPLSTVYDLNYNNQKYYKKSNHPNHIKTVYHRAAIIWQKPAHVHTLKANFWETNIHKIRTVFKSDNRLQRLLSETKSQNRSFPQNNVSAVSNVNVGAVTYKKLEDHGR